MKTFYVTKQDGTHDKGWQFGTFKATQLISGKKPRQVIGWAIISPDGCERFCEGNYQQFVPFANTILSNYGCNTNIS